LLIIRVIFLILIKKQKYMKNLKLLLLTLLSVISFNLFSQNMVITTNTSGPNVCDGTAILDTTNVPATSIFWQGMGAIINQGSDTVTNLCPGTYSVTFTVNGTPVTETFTITSNPCFGFSGTLTTTNQTVPTLCDGGISVSLNGGTAPYTYMWNNGSITQTISQLCTGYYCCDAVDGNGCTLTMCDSIWSQPQPPVGDTLVFNVSNCMMPVDTIVTSMENCNFNFNAVDTAFLSYVNTPTNPNGNMTMNWTFIDTNGVMTWMDTYSPMVSVDGCYNFTLVLFCSQKSPNIKTIIVNAAHALFVTAGLDEVTDNKKELVKVIDMMGRETTVEPNKLLIYVYSDGTTEKVYTNK